MTINTLTILAAAQDLATEPGGNPNPEYDRALVDLSYALIGYDLGVSPERHEVERLVLAPRDRVSLDLFELFDQAEAQIARARKAIEDETERDVREAVGVIAACVNAAVDVVNHW